jgi:hypothetical protein
VVAIAKTSAQRLFRRGVHVLAHEDVRVTAAAHDPLDRVLGDLDVGVREREVGGAAFAGFLPEGVEDVGDERLARAVPARDRRGISAQTGQRHHPIDVMRRVRELHVREVHVAQSA